MAMLVRDVMTRDPVIVGPETTTVTLREVMRQRHIHHLPVAEDGRLIGVVDATQVFGWAPRTATAADLAGRTVEAHPEEGLFEVLGRCAWSPRDVCVVTHPDENVILGILTDRDIIRLAAQTIEPDRLVDEIASTSLVTAAPLATVGECLHRLREQMFRHLVVIDDSGCLQGVASLRALLVTDARGPVASTLPTPAPQGPWTLTIRDAAALMERLDIDALPIVNDEGAPEGLVTVTDLLRALRSTAEVVA
ncbi:MAG: CBS domain-containing protein [Myxococcota bacterium]